MVAMKRTLTIMGIIFVLILGLSVIFVTGCAKKEVVKGEMVATEQGPAAIQSSEAELQKEREAALKQKALAEREASRFEDVNFDLDQFNLKPRTREILRQHADWLLEYPDFSVVIEGHCDERGTNEYNLALGERRAASAMEYLVNLGVDKKRLTTISYGEELPLDPRHNEEGWARNRRAHFVVTPKR